MFTGRRRHSRCALFTGVHTCALPIFEVTDLVHYTVVRRAVEARTDRRHGLFLRLHHEVHGAGEELAARSIDLAAGGERAGIDKAEAGGEALLEDRKSVV